MCSASKSSKPGCFPHSHSTSHTETPISLFNSFWGLHIVIFGTDLLNISWSIHFVSMKGVCGGQQMRDDWRPVAGQVEPSGCARHEEQQEGGNSLWSHKNFWISEICFNFPVRRNALASDGFHWRRLCQNRLKRSLGRLKRLRLSSLSVFPPFVSLPQGYNQTVHLKLH